MASPLAPVGRVNLIDVDRELVAGNGGGAALPVPVLRLPPGPMPALAGETGGFLVLKGLLMHEVAAYGRATADLLGPGDYIAPGSEAATSVPTAEAWLVLEEALLGDLAPNRAWSAEMAQRLTAGLLARNCERAAGLAIQRSIASHVRVDVRVLGYLWYLAERYGVVTPDGVKLSLPLTHAVIARLIGARRPTVTTALQRLMQQGYLSRDGRAFILAGDPGRVIELESQSPALLTNGMGQDGAHHDGAPVPDTLKL